MTAPAAVPALPALGVNQEVPPQEDFAHLSTRILVREASKVVADLGLHLDGSRLRRLVRRYVRDGRCDIDFRSWFISYTDPTGETAVRNVLRDGRGVGGDRDG